MRDNGHAKKCALGSSEVDSRFASSATSRTKQIFVVSLAISVLLSLGAVRCLRR